MSDRSLLRPLRFLVFGGIGVALLWAIVNHSLVAALVRIDPSYALEVRPTDPAALEALIDRAISAARRNKAGARATARFDFKVPIDPSKPAPSGSEAGVRPPPPLETDEEVVRRENLRAWASAILTQEPGNARALATLAGLERGTAGDEQKVGVLMRAAAQRTLRDPVPHAWLLHAAIQERDWPLAMQRVDILMRMHDQSIRHLTPLLAHLAETREAAAVVRDALLQNPPWRGAFLSEMLGAITDVRTPLDLLLALKDTPTPPTHADLRAYLDFLIHRRFYDLAYYTWLQFLPPEQRAGAGPLFNGDFEFQPSGQAFDWQLPRGGTAAVWIGRRPDRPSERALVISFGHGRVELGATTQLLRLRPGAHQVTGEVMGEVLGRRGVRWMVTCLGDKKREIGESEAFTGSIKEWRGFVFSVDVPEADCTAQTLSLVLDPGLPSERLISGSISFDEMSIRRVPETARVPIAGPSPSPQSQPRQR